MKIALTITDDAGVPYRGEYDSIPPEDLETNLRELTRSAVEYFKLPAEQRHQPQT